MSRETKTAHFFLHDSCIERLNNGVGVTLPIDQGKELWEFLGEQYQLLPKSEWSVDYVDTGFGDQMVVFTCENCHTKYKRIPKYCMECGAKGISESKILKKPYKE